MPPETPPTQQSPVFSNLTAFFSRFLPPCYKTQWLENGGSIATEQTVRRGDTVHYIFSLAEIQDEHIDRLRRLDYSITSATFISACVSCHEYLHGADPQGVYPTLAQLGESVARDEGFELEPESRRREPAQLIGQDEDTDSNPSTSSTDEDVAAHLLGDRYRPRDQHQRQRLSVQQPQTATSSCGDTAHHRGTPHSRHHSDEVEAEQEHKTKPFIASVGGGTHEADDSGVFVDMDTVVKPHAALVKNRHEDDHHEHHGHGHDGKRRRLLDSEFEFERGADFESECEVEFEHEHEDGVVVCFNGETTELGDKEGDEQPGGHDRVSETPEAELIKRQRELQARLDSRAASGALSASDIDTEQVVSQTSPHAIMIDRAVSAHLTSRSPSFSRPAEDEEGDEGDQTSFFTSLLLPSPPYSPSVFNFDSSQDATTPRISLADLFGHLPNVMPDLSIAVQMGGTKSQFLRRSLREVKNGEGGFEAVRRGRREGEVEEEGRERE